jgi:DMSO/TMAO reductase YedYZ heme-binding membrane subunit
MANRFQIDYLNSDKIPGGIDEATLAGAAWHIAGARGARGRPAGRALHHGRLAACRALDRTRGFPLLILTYSASSLARLWPGPETRALLRERRYWGLGFAACHMIHLAALITFLRLSGTQRPLPTLLGGGLAYVLLIAMALTSTDAAMRRLGKGWKRLHTFGIHWLWFIFAFSYVGRIARPETRMIGLIGGGIAIAALGLRIAARVKTRRPAALSR